MVLNSHIESLDAIGNLKIQGHDHEKVPVIDFSRLHGADHGSICKEIVHASSEWGFFQIVNHGVSESLIEEAKKVSRAFFKLPDAERMKFKVRPGSFSGYYSNKIDSIDIGGNNLVKSVDHLYHFFSPASMINLDLWSHSLRGPMDLYAKELRRLAENILAVLSEALGLRPTYITEVFGGSACEPSQSIRINFYRMGGAGIDSHSDPGGLTILSQGTVEGLQVRKGEKWLIVEPIPNAFVVNVGDQLEIVSNGRFKSVDHKGVANSAHERLSLAMFYSPAYDEVIGPAQGIVDENNTPPLYKPTKYSDYISAFSKRGLDSKNLVQSVKLT